MNPRVDFWPVLRLVAVGKQSDGSREERVLADEMTSRHRGGSCVVLLYGWRLHVKDGACWV